MHGWVVAATDAVQDQGAPWYPPLIGGIIVLILVAMAALFVRWTRDR